MDREGAWRAKAGRDSSIFIPTPGVLAARTGQSIRRLGCGADRLALGGRAT
jgi:hypothetical protein